MAASDPNRTSGLARHSRVDPRAGSSEGTLARKVASGYSADCVPNKASINSRIIIALRTTSRHIDQMYKRALASAYTVVWLQHLSRYPVGRISQRSPLYRDKELICRDLAIVLSDTRLTYCAKFAVIDQAIWIWSEFDGKYVGCKQWSVKALRGWKVDLPLIHEHPVPRKEIRERLFKLQSPTASSVRKVLDRLCFGVVVTKMEDVALIRAGLNAKMPEDWDGKDVYARYKVVGIEVQQVAT